MIKKIIVILICVPLILSLFSVSNSVESFHWYFKKNKNAAPTFPPEASIVKEYGGYYIDENASDENKVIYLTFDAGYENGNVEKILNILKTESVPAAFFLLDNIIIKNTDLVIRMAEEGHLVCNHTKNHKNLSCSSAEEIKNNLTALEMIYEEKCGKKLSKYFRFPEGNYSINALKQVENLGYKTIFWSFAYDDWDNSRQTTSSKAIKKILDSTHNGEILLLHPTSKTNVEILPTLISEWKKMGYRFGTLDELTK